MDAVESEGQLPLRLVRVDRVTGDEFPVGDQVDNLWRGMLKADEETESRSPSGDVFILMRGEVTVYNPTLSQ